jgi:hypothetical protein
VIASALAFAAATAAPKQFDMSAEDSRLVVRDFARCEVKIAKKPSIELVEANPSQWPGTKLPVVAPQCLPQRTDLTLSDLFWGTGGFALRGRMTHFRYALAEALLHQTYRKAPPVILASAAALDHSPIPAGSPKPAAWNSGDDDWQKAVAQSQVDAQASAFGECVVRGSPAEAWALLNTDVASPAEMSAFKALTPALAGCMTKVGMMPKGKFNVRGTIALNYYRLAQASVVSGKGPVK